jgi:hypothetical protein
MTRAGVGVVAIITFAWGGCGTARPVLSSPTAIDGGEPRGAGPAVTDAGGEQADAGSVVDGGRVEDGGARTDGGPSVDGGSRVDGGRAGLDGGARLDGGTTNADGGMADTDDAEIVSHDLPATMMAGQAARVTIVVANKGTSTWTRALGYKLGGVGDEDPFAPARIELPDGVFVRGDRVSPGTHAFTTTLVAPSAAGSYTTDWRMLREHVRWFGQTVTQHVEVRAFEGCMNPTPPPIDQFRVVVHNDVGFRKVLDSTALFYGREYCAEIGFTDGRIRCPVRPEGHPEVEACNELTVGRASDTGRVGPTWTYNGNPCNDSAEPGTCKNHGENQYLVFVYGAGTARACSASRVCGELTIP